MPTEWSLSPTGRSNSRCNSCIDWRRVEPYGVGIKKENVDLVRFVNAVLQRMRDDGTWEALYNANLRSFGPSPGPPPAQYQD